MNITEFNLFEDNDLDYKSSFPLFNFDALIKSQVDEIPLNFISSQKVSDIVEEILFKKVKVNETREVIAKKRGRKAVTKNGKQWDDPTITIQEIIENDLVGTPMESEIKMKEERLKKIKERKTQKKNETGKNINTEVRAIENFTPITGDSSTFTLAPLNDNIVSVFTQKIAFKDGKIVIDNSAQDENEKKLIVVDNKKPYKLTSMSFRTKNTTAKWTPEETKKFFKAIEIFGADFSLIAKLFPTRNRDQIKNKFNKEEKINAIRINEAFKRNTILGKRSIMDRIRNFTNILNSEDKMISAPNAEFDLELGGIKALERQYSNTSTDSMDLKIMEEIQDIFIKEIRPSKNIFAPIPTINMIADRSFGFSNVKPECVRSDSQIFPFKGINETVEPNTERTINTGLEQTRKEDGFNPKENLLLRYLL
jgi:hypothetical protein